MGKTQRLNSHRCVRRHPVTSLVSLSFPLQSFHPSLPHRHDLVINLVEISCSLINARPPPLFCSSRFLFRLYRIWAGFYSSLRWPSLAVEDEVMFWRGR